MGVSFYICIVLSLLYIHVPGDGYVGYGNASCMSNMSLGKVQSGRVS